MSEDTAKEAAQRKAEAQKHFDIILKSGAMESVSSMRIGWHAAYLKKNDLFGILGFKTESEARQAAGVGESTWYANIRLAEAFEGITEAQFVSMKQASAKALSDLPESKRKDGSWIRWAGSMKIEDFAAKCDEVMDGKAKPSDTKERGVVIKMSVPKSRKESLEHHLERCATQMGINPDDKGKVVEMLAVERDGQTGLIEAITNAVQRIKAAKKLQEDNLSAEEALEKVNVLLDEMALEFHDALTAASDGVQNLESA
jgi:hypothetical protein